MTRLGAIMDNENTCVMLRLDYLCANAIGMAHTNPLKRKKNFTK